MQPCSKGVEAWCQNLQEEIFEVGSEGMSVGELADRLAVNSGDVLKTLFLKGIMAQVNQVR